MSSGFERLSTVVHLHGAGHEGVGEDVVYDAGDQNCMQQAGPVQPVAGEFALGEFCELIDSLDLFPVSPSTGGLAACTGAGLSARRLTWRCARREPLHEALGREARPLTFVVSLGLGDPATLEPLRRGWAPTRRCASSSTPRAPGRRS